jgi:CxxC motif-containing protein (DUF1111 family)
MDAFVRRSWVAYALSLTAVCGAESRLGQSVVLAQSTEAPTGFDGQTNGLTTQGQFLADREIFNDQEQIEDGLGPVYNAQSCGECHQNPISGGATQISELRAGRFNGGTFTEHPGGSLIHSRAIDAAIQERLSGVNNVRSFRLALSVLGDGFVESIDDQTFIAIANAQPPALQGEIVSVPVLEAGGALRVGRFGWKNQHASLVSFAADAYLNEMGITSPLQPTENTSNGQSVAAFDQAPDPEDNGEDIQVFARFMRATKAPPRDDALAATPDAQAGSQLFDQIGCATCHVRTITTAPLGTLINGGAFTVPPELGNKVIHPFSDFLLHDIGTGDGIVQNGGPSTRNKVRTAPLWGLRTRNLLIHDGASLTRNEAILRHRGQANFVTRKYLFLTFAQQQQLIIFLNSL